MAILAILSLLILLYCCWAGIVGPVFGGDGSTPATGRQAKTGEANVCMTHGKYYEPASRGVIFAACDQGVGVAVQATITTTGILSLQNPALSAKRLAIKKVSISYFSGTLGAGSFYHGFNAVGIVQPSAGTALTSNCTDITNMSSVVAVGVARTAATVVAATVLYPFASALPVLASTAVAFPPIIEDVDGLIVLEPGTAWQLVAVMGAAGTTPKISCGIVWEEVPYVSSQG